MRMKTARCSNLGMIFSMPMQAMCSLGTLALRSALPSLVQTTKLPVSAIAKLVRVIVARLRPDCTRKNFRNIVPQLVDRGNDDVAGRFIIELLDTLAKVGLD